jgi:hypothetical protein
MNVKKINIRKQRRYHKNMKKFFFVPVPEVGETSASERLPIPLKAKNKNEAKKEAGQYAPGALCEVIEEF